MKIGRWWPTNLLRQQVFALKSALWLRTHRSEYDVLHVNGFITWMPADVNTAHFVHSGWFGSKYYPFGLTKGVWSAYQFVYTRVNASLERWAYRRSRVALPPLAGDYGGVAKGGRRDSRDRLSRRTIVST